MRKDSSFVRPCGLPGGAIRLAVVLLIAAILGLFSAGSSLAGRMALVIGNGAYRNAGELANPPKDAAAIAEKLRTLGFEVTELQNGDLRSMRASLDQFSKAATSAELAVIFYAGHGLQVDGENYLIPVDANMGSRDDLPKSALRASEIYKSLVDAGPDAAVLIFDACRDNPFTQIVSTAPGLASGSASTGSLVQRPNAAGMLIGFAAAPGAVAYDGKDGNSPFTTALLQWIDRPGVEVGTMMRRVRGTVVELTRGAQVPWVEEALLREVYLYPDPNATPHLELGAKVQVALLDTMRALSLPEERDAAQEYYKRLTGDEKTAVLVLGAPAQSSPRNDEEFVKQGLVWLSIRESRDPEIFQKYVDTFPDSPFTLAAAERLKEIEAERKAAPIQVASLETKSGILILGALPAGEVVSSDVPAINPVLTQTVTPIPVDEGNRQSVSTLGTDTDKPTVHSGTPVDKVGVPIVQQEQISPVQPDGPVVAAIDITPTVAEEDEAGLGLERGSLAAVQMLLTEAGEYNGKIDGDIGPRTRKAIASFQTAASLEGEGYLNQPTLQQLLKRFGRTVLNNEPNAEQRASIHLLAAVASRGASAKPIILRVADIDRNDDVHAFWQDLAVDFEAAHPGYRVEMSHQPDYEYKAALLGILGSSTPPDIMHTWGGGHLDALRDAGFARDLTEDMADGWALEFRPAPLQSYARDGHIYGVPASVALVSLWVNKTLLAKAGMTPDQLSTWDGFLEAVRALKANGIVPIAIGGRDRWQFQFLWGGFAEQIGGREAYANAVVNSGDGFAAPAFVEAGDRLRQLADLEPFQPDFINTGEGDAGMLFTKGGAAMAITGNWRLTTMRWNWPGGFDRMKQELVRLDLPGSVISSDPLTYGGVDGYVVHSRAPDMAVELLRVLTSRAVQTRIATLSDAIPSVSGADLALTDPYLSDVANALLSSSYHQLYVDQALGPIAGEVVNDVATKLATREIDGRGAAEEIDRAWDLAAVGAPAIIDQP